MRYTELLPPPAIADIVHCFWFLQGDLRTAAEQPIVADGRLEIVLHAAAPFEAHDPVGRTWRPQADALMTGQLLTPMRLRPAGESDVVGIRLRTDAASAVLAMPLLYLTDRVVPIAELHASLADELRAAIARSTDPLARVAALAAVLQRFRRRDVDPAVRQLVRDLDRPNAPTVGNAATRTGLSARTIERRVEAATGLTPATLRSVLRFRRCYQQLEAAGVGRWGRVAIETGYYDQAHCIRDFRRFTGASPGNWFGRERGLADAFLSGPRNEVRDTR